MDWENPDLSAWEQYANPFAQKLSVTEFLDTLPGNYWIDLSQSIQVTLQLIEGKWAQEILTNLNVSIKK